MSEYVPDVWIVIKMVSPEHGETFKILAGWYGGYTNGDAWKINSGITKVVDAGEWWEVHGWSGSVYKCHKESERMSNYTYAIFTQFANAVASKGSDYSFAHVDAAEVFGQFIGTLAQG